MLNKATKLRIFWNKFRRTLRRDISRQVRDHTKTTGERFFFNSVGGAFVIVPLDENDYAFSQPRDETGTGAVVSGPTPDTETASE